MGQTALLQAQHLCLDGVSLGVLAEYAKCDISEEGVLLPVWNLENVTRF